MTGLKVLWINEKLTLRRHFPSCLCVGALQTYKFLPGCSLVALQTDEPLPRLGLFELHSLPRSLPFPLALHSTASERLHVSRIPATNTNTLPYSPLLCLLLSLLRHACCLHLKAVYKYVTLVLGHTML